MANDAYEIWYEQLQVKLKAAVASALPLVCERRYDEAEMLIRAVDSDIYGCVATGRMYESLLGELAAAGAWKTDRAFVDVIFQKAVDWTTRAYPEPHTAIEAGNYNAGRSEDVERLTRILRAASGAEQANHR